MVFIIACVRAMFQLCKGATKEERAIFHLKDATQFNYLKRSNCIDIPGGRMDDSIEYANTKKAMDIVGMFCISIIVASHK